MICHVDKLQPKEEDHAPGELGLPISGARVPFLVFPCHSSHCCSQRARGSGGDVQVFEDPIQALAGAVCFPPGDTFDFLMHCCI